MLKRVSVVLLLVVILASSSIVLTAAAQEYTCHWPLLCLAGISSRS